MRTWSITPRPTVTWWRSTFPYRKGPLGDLQDRNGKYVVPDCGRRQCGIGRHLRPRPRSVLHRGGRGRNWRKSCGDFIPLPVRTIPDIPHGEAAKSGHGIDVGRARNLRSGSQDNLLGHRQSHAGTAHGSPRRQSGRGLADVACRALQQFHGGARSRDGKADLVLPASARGRLGQRSHSRENPLRTNPSIPIPRR